MPLISKHHTHLAACRERGATRPGRSAVLRARTETTLGKALPDLALVHAAGERCVSVEDGIAGLYEVGAAWLTGKSLLVMCREVVDDKMKGKTYSAIPSMTNFIVRYFPSVGTPPLNVGFAALFLPYLSIKFHMTS